MRQNTTEKNENSKRMTGEISHTREGKTQINNNQN
jgi:hypothetical protein